MLEQLLSNPIFVGALGAGGMATVVGFVWRYWSRILQFVFARITISLTVDTSNDLYPFTGIVMWLDSTTYSQKYASRLFASSIQGIRNAHEIPVASADGSTRESNKQPITMTPAMGTHTFRDKGVWYIVNRALVERQGHGKMEEITVTTFFKRRDHFEQLIHEGNAKLNSMNEDSLVIRVFSSFGEWHTGYHTKRPLSSVFFPEGFVDDVLSDMRDFYASRKEYMRRGQPWRHGYVFSGPPGCGKSSLIAVLASEMGLPIYYLNLSSVDSDDRLLSVMRQIPSRALLVIEDIDTFAVTNKRAAPKIQQATARGDGEKNEDRLTLSGLLNATDGLVATEGRILIYTSNHPEKLDPALVRAGRIDRHFRFTLGTAREAGLMYMNFYNVDTVDERLTAIDTISLNDLQSAFLTYPKDPYAGVGEALRISDERKNTTALRTVNADG